VLVATSVIEVGIDVPNATVMLIEAAERYGLSQLHQLRGRVGRGAHQSYCFLVYQSPLSEEARERLKGMTETTDGFEIAERDLLLRGPGDFFGTRQAGMPTFRLIDLVRDRELLDVAQKEAAAWFDRSKPGAAAVGRLIENWEERFKLIEVG
ncbi:MAG TPA: helicase-related protein, partial [Vicinamibacterales bacterium]